MSAGTRSGVNWMRWNSTPSALGEGLDRQRLGQAGHALDQEVAAGQEGDDHPLEQAVLADDDPLDLVEDLLERGLAASSAGTGLPALIWSARRRPRRRSRSGPRSRCRRSRRLPAGLARPVTIPIT